MRDKLNQFVSNQIGNFVEVSYKEAIYQCMDLVYEWIFVLDIPKSTIQHQYAFEVYTQTSDLTREYFEVIENKLETIPQTGDLVVWNKTSSNVAGHIAIVIEATQSTMKIFEQNNPLGTNPNIRDRNYTNVLGFLRPKKAIIEGVPQWLNTLLQERGLTLLNESEIRIIFEKAKKYDDDIKDLQEQVKTANESLADKSLEVSSLTTKNQQLSTRVEELEILYNNTKTERDAYSWEKEKLAIEADKNAKIIQDLQKDINVWQEENTALRSEVESLKKASIKDLDTKTIFRFWWGRVFGRK